MLGLVVGERERERDFRSPIPIIRRPAHFETILPSFFFSPPPPRRPQLSLSFFFLLFHPTKQTKNHQFPADSASLGASLDPGSMPDGEGNAGNTNTNTNNINTSGGGGGNTATRGAATAGAGATTDNGALPGGAGGAAAAAAGAHTYVWGTNIDIASISRRLRRFLTGKSFFFFFF